MTAQTTTETTTETITEPKRGRGRPPGSRNRPNVPPPPLSKNGRQAFAGRLTMDVASIELDGAHWVQIMLGDREWKKFGPYASADMAAAKAEELVRSWGGTAISPPTNDVITLNGKLVEIGSPEGCTFVRDAVRAAEGLCTDADLKEKYELTTKNLKEMTKNPALIRAIRDERERRMRSGQAARESASRHFVRAPDIMNNIMSNEQSNARHRIEAARELRATATGSGDESLSDASEKFVITINLGADHIERFEKEIVPRKPAPLLEHEGRPNADE